MTKDLNKGIFNITYNHLNLPVKIDFSQRKPLIKEITYRYDATGTKLEKSVKDGTTITTQYAGGFIYNNNGGDQKLQFFSHPEGYVEPVGGTERSVKGFELGVPGPTYSSYKYVFQYKDHLGNVRLSYSDSDLNGAITPDEIIEESNYYPFGLEHKGYNTNKSSFRNALAQQWKFGGKEYNEELRLNWYDITARNYDPALGRWMNVDPLAEYMFTHSPYSFAFNNPVYYIDPDGLMPRGVTDSFTMGFADLEGEGKKLDSEFPDTSGEQKLPVVYLGVVMFNPKGVDGGLILWGNDFEDRGHEDGTIQSSIDVNDFPMSPSGGTKTNGFMKLVRDLLNMLVWYNDVPSPMPKPLKPNESTMEISKKEPVEPPEEDISVELKKITPYFRRWNYKTYDISKVKSYDTLVKKTVSIDILIRSKDSINKKKKDEARKKFNERQLY